MRVQFPPPSNSLQGREDMLPPAYSVILSRSSEHSEEEAKNLGVGRPLRTPGETNSRGGFETRPYLLVLKALWWLYFASGNYCMAVGSLPGG